MLRYTVVRSFLPRLTLTLALAGWAACTTREPVPEDDASGETTDDDPGDQPTAPGAMFSSCTDSSQCDPQEFCVFPADETGYCTSACAAPLDTSACDPAPGDQPLACFDIGLADGRVVCAIDCASDECPRGMRCEAVTTASGDALICF